MTDETRVLYNGDCPVCATEIGHYARYSEGQDLPIRFDDLTSADLARWGVDADAAARRLHVLDRGRVVSGFDAFLVLWRQMPRYRRLARVMALPGLRHGASALYDRVLAPLLYRAHLRRQARAGRRGETRGRPGPRGARVQDAASSAKSAAFRQ